MRYLFKIFFFTGTLLLVSLSLLVLEERKLFDTRGLQHKNPIPYTKELIKKEKYLDAQEYLEYFMQFDYVKENPQSQKLLHSIKEKRESYEYKKDKIIEGLLSGKSDEDIGKASAIASDFLLIGDIRDLSIQGSHYYHDEKVDKVLLALSSLGLIATVSTIYTLGATAPLKTSVSVLKYAKKANKLPSWLNEKLIKEAKVSKKTKSLKNITHLLDPIHTLYNKLGLTQTLKLLKTSKSLKELNNMVSFTSRFGKQSQILLKSTQNRAIYYSKLLPKAKTKNIFYASSYGTNGLKAMSKMGEAKFMLRMANKKGLALLKTGYKGNFNSLINYLLKHIPTWLLFTLSFLGLTYFMKKFYNALLVYKNSFWFKFL